MQTFPIVCGRFRTGNANVPPTKGDGDVLLLNARQYEGGESDILHTRVFQLYALFEWVTSFTYIKDLQLILKKKTRKSFR